MLFFDNFSTFEKTIAMSIQIDYREAIRSHYAKLGKKKRVIADMLLKSPLEAIEKSISELADACGCEQTAIIRFSQQLGYAGYAELKLAVATQTGAVWQDFPTSSTESFKTLCNQLSTLHNDAVRKTLNGLEEKTLDALSSALSHARRVMVAGSGSSRLAAADLQLKLSRLDLNVVFFEDQEVCKTLINYLNSNDVLILFSDSGQTESIIGLAQTATQHGVMVCAVTSSLDSPLASTAQLVLHTSGHEHPYRIGSISAQAAQFAVSALIALHYASADREKSQSFIVKAYDTHE